MTVHLDPYRAFLEAKVRMATATLFDLGSAEGWLPEQGEAA